jgi:hypothetical protein
MSNLSFILLYGVENEKDPSRVRQKQAHPQPMGL